MTIPHEHRIGRRRNTAATLVELVVSLSVVSVLLLSLGGALMIASRGTNLAPADHARESRDVLGDVLADVRQAKIITGDTTTLTLTVPDRDTPPDGVDDMIVYAWDGASGSDLTRTRNGGAAVTVASDVHHLNFDFITRFTPGQPPESYGDGNGLKVLMVVRDTINLTDQETFRESLLGSWGHTITRVDHNASQSTFDGAIATTDVIYVPEEIDASAIGAKVTAAAIGIVNEDLELCDELGLANSTGNATGTSIDIRDSNHYITDPYTTGWLTVFDAVAPMGGINGARAPGLLMLAKDGGVDQLDVIESGDEGMSGPVAGRRVQLPWGGDALDLKTLTLDGRTILQRSLEWAAGVTGGGGPAESTFGYDTQFASSNSGVRRIQIATQATLTEGGTVTSLSAYVDGNGGQVRLALYDDAGGDPGNLIVETDTASPGEEWLTLPVTSTALTPGTYWLALSFHDKNARYFFESGGETRYASGWATKSGFSSSWGTSTNYFVIKMSMYATYVPD